ncbi:protein NUCLEAR FUSION DEFECTIVE 6, chloroplastic/mitochondrial-like [Papaver somniferum]|uniref:protein NUCLEAR FUSION DEFECTIVE 6, chloroplastic/mitochondrial-like n=1 Tax=Papaver somniferum TaxID=3469 RepID=UPI000E702FB9|nr:protein NUCLEAR FUSION DEFECTIVE 6, chloroplastic/mitochondrial-like [Papaver somniferum]
MAAANCARRAFQSFTKSSSAPPSFASGAAKFGGFTSTAKPTSTPRFLKSTFSSRLPVLGCAQSLMPLHSVTSSALLTSKLSLKAGNWAWLSEGYNQQMRRAWLA